jgi:hypothetical protein
MQISTEKVNKKMKNRRKCPMYISINYLKYPPLCDIHVQDQACTSTIQVMNNSKGCFFPIAEKGWINSHGAGKQIEYMFTKIE